ncbi:hypothetical protein CI610_01706 [invertebrate metagenome]|uniref:Uncharacterized protein n=1 Tax=invertebrate metagenome TaxID=1711999 RepID=A0A2H9T7V6_9ZZZZ
MADPMKKWLKKATVLCSILWLLSGQTVQADDASSNHKPIDTPWYQIDAIVFLHNNYQQDKELWRTSAAPSLPDNAIKLELPAIEASTMSVSFDEKPINPNSLPVSEWSENGYSNNHYALYTLPSFTQLPKDQQRLTQEASRLKRSSDYTVLQQVAWRQPLTDKGIVVPVIVSLLSSSQSPYELSGVISIRKNKHLYVDVNMQYSQIKNILTQFQSKREDKRSESMLRPELLLENDTEPHILRETLRTFSLTEHRGIPKTEQVQYFDSPVLGILLKITPYEDIVKILQDEKQPEIKTSSPSVVYVLTKKDHFLE